MTGSGKTKMVGHMPDHTPVQGGLSVGEPVELGNGGCTQLVHKVRMREPAVDYTFVCVCGAIHPFLLVSRSETTA